MRDIEGGESDVVKKTAAGVVFGASASASVSAGASIKYAVMRGIGVKVWIPLLGVGGGLAVCGLTTVASAVYLGYLIGKTGDSTADGTFFTEETGATKQAALSDFGSIQSSPAILQI